MSSMTQVHVHVETQWETRTFFEHNSSWKATWHYHFKAEIISYVWIVQLVSWWLSVLQIYYVMASSFHMQLPDSHHNVLHIHDNPTSMFTQKCFLYSVSYKYLSFNINFHINLFAWCTWDWVSLIIIIIIIAIIISLLVQPHTDENQALIVLGCVEMQITKVVCTRDLII